MASTKQAALAKARQRRLALDQDRAARDSRVELAAAEVYVLIEERVASKRAMQTANAAIGAVLRRLCEQEGLSVDGVGRLCELEPAEVRRLTRTAATPPAPPETVAAATVAELRPTSDIEPAAISSPDAVGTANATRRNQ